MRGYPKGCRCFFVISGHTSEMRKVTTPTTIETLLQTQHWGSPLVHLVVQPRGKKKWWLFVRHHGESPRMVGTAQEPDSLIMRALLTE